jgi:hypothetical protein
MMKRFLTVSLAAGLLASTASAATQLNVRVVSGGSSDIIVSTGQVVDYQVLGQLQNDTNQGLALFAFTLSYDCGDLQQADPPTEGQTPGITECLPAGGKGMTNPSGFGGTTDVPSQLGDLVQVGCAFNTILNTLDFAPFPLGTVVLDIGITETVLAQGQLTFPANATTGQVCTLSISQVIANTILLGEVEDGTHWAVEAAAQGATTPLLMTNQCLVASASAPSCDGVLPRSAGTVIRVQYPSDHTASIPLIQVQELLDGGLFGADVTDQFIIVDEGGNSVLLTNNGTPLLNRTWYAVSDGCNQFDFVVMYGNVDGDGDTDALDANAIWINRLNPVNDDTPYDVDGDGDVDALDVNAAWNNRDALVPAVPAKPTLHTCPQ